MSIDPHSSTPVYQQIADYLRHAIAARVYRPGEMIPSVRALALQLAVNPNTVARAFEILERDGLIYPRKGRGMFVTNHAAKSAQNDAAATVHDLFSRGIQAGFEADMSARQIRQTFSRAFNAIQTDARNKP